MILFTLFIIIPLSVSAPIDSCTSITNCGSCTNSTNDWDKPCQWCISSNACSSYHISCSVDDQTLDSYNCPRDVSHIKYDEYFMRHTVVPLIAATHSPDRNALQSSLKSCFGSNIEIINRYQIFCDHTNITTCSAYSVYLKDHNAMVMIFRGTSTLYQFIDEGISFFLTKRIKFEITKGVVDGYYLNAFYGLWNNGMKDDFETIKSKHIFANFWFFGHSLGGGLASIASAYTTKVYKLRSDKVKLVTFGMPRIGDIELAEEHDRLVPDSTRIEHSKDPIPAMPPRTFPDSINKGSFHHKLEIWYPEGMAVGSKYIIGSRPDTTVGRSIFPFNIKDHLRYFDVVLETWNGCHRL